MLLSSSYPAAILSITLERQLDEMNADETEFIWLGTRQQLAKVNLKSLVIGDQSIILLQNVRDLGVIIDDELTMESHVPNVVVWNSFYQLRRLRTVRR